MILGSDGRPIRARSAAAARTRPRRMIRSNFVGQAPPMLSPRQIAHFDWKGSAVYAHGASSRAPAGGMQTSAKHNA